MFFEVFENVTFWVFAALDGPLGHILPPSWADLVPKWTPKCDPKVVQNVIKFWVKNDTKNEQKFTKKLGPNSVALLKKSL